MEHQIKSLKVYDKKADGSAYIKNGKQFARISAKFENDQDRFVTIFWWDLQNLPQVGTKLTGEIKENGEYQGKPQYIFEFPKKGIDPKTIEEMQGQIAMLKLQMAEVLDFVRKGQKPKIAGTDIDYPTPEDEGLDDGIPFED